MSEKIVTIITASRISVQGVLIADHGDGGYWLGMNEGQLNDYEIVQSAKCDHAERIKIEIADEDTQ